MLEQNQIFADKYKLLRKIGSGSFGDVWLAEYQGVEVAVKIYNQLDQRGVEDFKAEFKIAFELNHTNLLHISNYDVCDNHPFLVMPYCPNGSAEKLINNADEKTLWHFIRDVAAGLAYLHRQDPPLVHQDIKPANILLDKQGDFIITDFGISKRIRSSLNKSARNITAGTTAYMGPERFGKHPAPIKASDIWSLGATIFEIMTGDVPFGNIGGSLQINGAVVPEIEENYTERLKQLVEDCLACDPWDRPTAEELSEYASDVLKGRTPETPWHNKSEKQENTPPNTSSADARKGRETQKKNFSSEKQPYQPPTPSKSTIPQQLKPKKKSLAWLWILLAVLVVGGGIWAKAGIDQYREKRDKLEQDRIADENRKKQEIAALNVEVVYVQGGTFTMGCTFEQGSDCYSDETPSHRVTVSSFYIGKYEVTQKLWEAVMGNNPSGFKGGNLPVENVSWDNCQEFILKLNSKTGKTFRLPTEAEWEYAARGGNKSNGYKYSGSNTLRDVAWFGQCNGNTYDNGNSGEKTHSVGSKSPNELGIYDMSGNVWEWCSDWYGSYSSGSQTNPTGPSSGSYRVLRGGSWNYRAWRCRVSNRFDYYPDYHDGFGFRLILVQ